MARIQYVARLAVDKNSGMPVQALAGQVVTIVKRGTATPVPITEDEAGTLVIPASARTVSADKFIPSFWVDESDMPVSALGAGVEVPLDTAEGIAKRLDALEPALIAASESASDAAATVATLQEWLDLGITRRNLVANPSARARPFGTAGATGVQTDETTDGPLGGGYRKLVLTGTTTSSPITIAPSATGTAAAPVVAGRTYTFSAYSRMVGGPVATQGGVDVNWYTASGVAAGNDSTYQGVLVNGVWTRHSKTVTAPAGAAFALVTARFSVTAGLPTAGAEYGAGGFMIEESSSLGAYFDGDAPSSTGRVNRWTGTPNASASEQLDMSSIKAIPPGGEPGQSLVKAGVEDWATAWATVTGGGGGSGIVGAPAVWPSAFPSSAHSHPRSQISDASTLGRSLLGAADAQAARALIGAGTGNGTSDLTLGTAGTQAAPGNHVHSASAVEFVPTGTITASNVQDAIAQAAQSGGGTGSSAIYVWKFNAGAYPTLPVTMPTGTLRVEAEGPISPLDSGAVIRSWIGPGPGKATLYYQYNPTLS